MYSFVPQITLTPISSTTFLQSYCPLSSSTFISHASLSFDKQSTFKNVFRSPQIRMQTVDDKTVVREYFNNVGFDRWNRIYSEDGSVNKVQLDIRVGHQQTVDKILAWIDQDGDAQSQSFCDAGCGVGSLSLPLADRGAKVAASDISQAMVEEGQRRAQLALGAKAQNVTFKTSDLESLSGSYDTVCCIDVMIHYPTDKAVEMLAHLTSMAKKRVIISFAPKTFYYVLLKKFGELFPGPSKATRAYLHSEDDIRVALETLGFEIKRTDFTATKFYFSKLIEATRK